MTLLSAVPVKSCKDRFGCEVFIETGCYQGAGLREAIAAGFAEERLYSCDLQLQAVEECRRQFPQAWLMVGDSLSFLKEYLPHIHRHALFWLDAHFPQVYGLDDQPTTKMPLFEELRLIRQLKSDYHRDVIICDDIHTIDDPANPTFRYDKVPSDMAPYYYTKASWTEFSELFLDTHELVILDDAERNIAMFLPQR